MDNSPLVSIPVITYNSSQYIIEGLESIKTQTYKNIELIISDDCSTDNTVEVCKKWIDENKQFFKRAIIVTTDKNTGVAGNLNRAIRECHGEWIKPLSGDDKFFPYTIEKYVDFINDNPQANVCFAPLKYIGSNIQLVELYKNYAKKWYYPWIQKSLKVQFNEILKRMYIPGPGLIYKKSLLIQLGGFDERYPFCEEDPLMYKILRSGNQIFFIDSELYVYEVTDNSLSRDGNTNELSKHMRDRIKYYKENHFFHLIKYGRYIRAIDGLIKYKIIELKYNRNKPLIILLKALRYLLPYYYQEKRMSK